MRKEYDFSNGKRGAVINSPGKTRITIMIDDDVLDAFRSKAEALGTGYQTMMNAALKSAVQPEPVKAVRDKPLTATVLRKILREEFRVAS